MSLRFIIGPSGSGKTTFITREMVKEASSHPQKRFFCIVPDQFTMGMQKAMVLESKGHAILNIEVLSFGRLSHRIFEELGPIKERMLDDTGKNLLIQRICVNHRDELRVLGRMLTSPSMIHEIKSAISEFMQYSVTEEGIDELIRSAEGAGRKALAYKLADLKLIYGYFLEELSGRFTTTEGRIGLLKTRIAKSKLLRDACIVFDGFTGFTPIQTEVITELLICCDRVTFTLTGEREMMEAPYMPQELFALSKRTVASIRRCLEESGAFEEDTIYLTDTLRFKSDSLKQMEHTLFRRRGTGKRSDGIELFCCNSPIDEIKYLGRKISLLVSQEGYAYRDIAVICPDMDTYGDGVSREFEKCGIPCFVDRPMKLSVNPVTEFILSALAVADTDYLPNEVRGYLKSGFGPLDEDDADFLEEIIYAKNIRGRSRWSKEYFGRNPDVWRGEADRVDILRKKVLESLSLLDRRQHSIQEFSDTLKEFLLTCEIEKKLNDKAEELSSLGRQKKADEFVQIYDYVIEVLNVLKELSDQSRVPLKYFREIFASALTEINVGTIPRIEDRVLVGDLERSRLPEIKVLFFIGLNDGSVPKSVNKGGIISDLDRQLLKNEARDIELAPTPRELMYRQRLYLYIGVTKPSEKLYALYSLSDMSGRAKQPSYFVEVLKGCFSDLTVRYENNAPKDYARLSDGLELMASGLRDYAKGFTPKDEELPDMLSSLYTLIKKDSKLSGLLDSMTEAAFYTYGNESISSELAEALYGQNIKGSISRLQVFATCPYQYFLRYGIGLRENEQGEITASLNGRLVHEILKRFGEELRSRNLLWHELSRDEQKSILEDITLGVFSTVEFEPYFTSGRSKYISSYMSRVAAYSADILTRQLFAGGFVPAEFEKNISYNLTLSNGAHIRMNEVVDRIDVYNSPNGCQYIKIIDYKTGNAEFSFPDTETGRKLQLPVYLKSVLDIGNDKTLPGAMFYYHAANPMIDLNNSLADEASVVELRLKELAPIGLVNSGNEVIEALDRETQGSDGSAFLPSKKSRLCTEDMLEVCNYAMSLCVKLGEGIVSGDISAAPYETNSKNGDPCGYCPYKKTCKARQNNALMYRKMPQVKDAEELIKHIRKNMSSPECEE